MHRLVGAVIISAVTWTAAVPAAAAPVAPASGRTAATIESVQQVQYGSCGVWRRRCADLYGWQTRRWHECMGQPKAIRDCGGYGGNDGGYRGDRVGRCEDWRQECANLYGYQTRRWFECMGQPNAVRACTR